jgi:UDP-N-acetylmuramoyl-tripeptide--D-alanyl-D-alanine ligase
MMLNILDVFEALLGFRPDLPDRVISEAAIDSRQVIPGALFVALPGERVDGHDFIAEAFRQKAGFALVQKDVSANFSQIDLREGFKPGSISKFPESPFCIRVEDTLTSLQKIARFWREKQDIRIIAITGSVGKSTTKELITDVLNQRYTTLKSKGNLNNEIGLPLTLLRLGSGYQRAVLEMGFYVPGEISFLCDLAKPQVGVITNIGTVHAERAGSQEEIARGKSELIQTLPSAPEGTAILNHDDPFVRPMAEITRARVFFYGLDPQADLWADEIEGLGLQGIRFRLHHRNETLNLRVPMIGEHSVHTALRAAAVGLVEGLSWAEIINGLQNGHSQLRLVVAHSKEGALILDDTYNASPESTLAALNLLDQMDGRKIAVLGDMLELGQYEKRGHEMVGVRAAQFASLIVLVGPRSKIIADAALRAGYSSEFIQWFDEAPQAAPYLQGILRKGDVVLVKGSRGLQMERIVHALEVEE